MTPEANDPSSCPTDTNASPTIAIVGATGAVGREMLAILDARRHPPARLIPLASARSVGTRIPYRNTHLTVQELTPETLAPADIVLLSAGSACSRAVVAMDLPPAIVLIDNASAFRMDPEVPLVIPEVNPHAVHALLDRTNRTRPPRPPLIANPNCSTIIMLMALTPIERAFGIKRIVVSTYQAASGAGAAAMDELANQSADVLAGRPTKPVLFPEPCAFNVFSHNTPIDPQTGMNVEEQKMVDETRKIWNDDTVAIAATCVRVPVLRAHAESIHVELKQPATESAFRAALAGFAGVLIVDDRSAGAFPTALKAAGRDEVLVGRIRPDPSLPSEAGAGGDGGGDGAGHFGFGLFVAGDQLRKGAALNAIQIMDLVRPYVTSGC